MRGEKEVISGRVMNCRGSPPHARGKEFCGVGGVVSPGITPARAGKRYQASYNKISSRDHPRMRGEKADPDAYEQVKAGSPPHARGKVKLGSSSGCPPGITPACAGKSSRGNI